MRRVVGSIVLVALVAGCGAGVDLTDPAAVRNVMISVDVPGQCLSSCDPPSSDRTTLALVQAVNRGSDTSYINVCGSEPAWTEQQFVGGEWGYVGPVSDCVVGPVSMPLAPGASLRVNWFPPKGQSRMTLVVASTPTLTDAAQAALAAVDIK